MQSQMVRFLESKKSYNVIYKKNSSATCLSYVLCATNTMCYIVFVEKIRVSYLIHKWKLTKQRYIELNILSYFHGWFNNCLKTFWSNQLKFIYTCAKSLISDNLSWNHNF